MKEWRSDGEKQNKKATKEYKSRRNTQKRKNNLIKSEILVVYIIVYPCFNCNYSTLWT